MHTYPPSTTRTRLPDFPSAESMCPRPQAVGILQKKKNLPTVVPTELHSNEIHIRTETAREPYGGLEKFRRAAKRTRVSC